MESFNQKIIKHKTGLLNLAAELGNISQACRIMGFSRDTFYRYQTARDSGGIEALFDANRRKPNLKNRVEEETEKAVVEFAVAFPAYSRPMLYCDFENSGDEGGKYLQRTFNGFCLTHCMFCGKPMMSERYQFGFCKVHEWALGHEGLVSPSSMLLKRNEV